MPYQMEKNQFNPARFNKVVRVENKPLPTGHLQPGNQKEFYVAELEDGNMPKASVQALREAVAQGSSLMGMKEPSASDTNGGYRKFEESMTYRNLTQPFKLSRLANPFPEPVKEMPSNKVSDQEKATQMYAESQAHAQAQAHFAQRQKQLKLKPQIPLQPNSIRHYSTGEKNSGTPTLKKPKCKVPKAKICRKLKTGKTCPPANKVTDCKDNRYVFRPCTKKEAPYPSYSEACHEERSTICRSCPWMDTIHPAFKPKKKNFHTASRAMSMSSSTLGTSLDANSGDSSHNMNEVNSVSDDGAGVIAMELKKRKKGAKRAPECESPLAKLKRVPCAWVELDKQEEKMRAKRRKPREPVVKKVPVCEEPKSNKRCPPSTNTNLPVDKKKRSLPIPADRIEELAAAQDAISSSLYVYEGESSPLEWQRIASPIPEDVAVPSAVGQSIDEWLAGLHPNKVETLSKVVSITSGGPCPKFPFKPLKFNLTINRKPKAKPSKCPKKSYLPRIMDCPPERKDCLAELFDDVLVFKSKVKDTKIIPKKQPNPGNPDDPCDRKQKPKSEICPDDLLTRKRKDKPLKRGHSYEGFEKAVAMLQSIERARSAPSVFKPHTFKY